ILSGVFKNNTAILAGDPLSGLDKMEQWKEYFYKMLNECNQTNNNNNKLIKEAKQDLAIDTNNFTMNELEYAMKNLKSGKSAGGDNIISEMLKFGGNSIKSMLLDICNKVYNSNLPPSQWLNNIIIPMYKKGNPTNMGNYRGITLMSIPAKLYNKILLNRIYPEINRILRPNQAGFRRNHSCIEHINTLRRIIEGTKDKQLPLITSYIDFAKAFDTINREKMFHILRHYGIPLKIVSAIKCLYDNSKSHIRIDGNKSDDFVVNTGILQGDTLAPFLFIIVMDYVLTNVPNLFGIVTHEQQNKSISDLEFADDVVLFDESPESARIHLTALINSADKVGLKVNIEKSKYMTNIKQNDPLIVPIIANIKTNNKSNPKTINDMIEKVSEFRYLGSLMSSYQADFNERKHKARCVFWSMKKVWNSKEISTDLKIKIFNVTCIPVLLYGCETWILTEKLKSDLDIFALNCYRWLLGIRKINKIKNEIIYNRVGKCPLHETVQMRQKNFIIKTQNKPDGNIAKTYLTYVPEHGKRRVGKPARSYGGYIASLMVDPT
ncbi:MAG: reverse transcriptase domain-containing protein, partial [Terriglobales bacterium]